MVLTKYAKRLKCLSAMTRIDQRSREVETDGARQLPDLQLPDLIAGGVRIPGD